MMCILDLVSIKSYRNWEGPWNFSAALRFELVWYRIALSAERFVSFAKNFVASAVKMMGSEPLKPQYECFDKGGGDP